ncbi:MAG TPA: Pvc16 family protein [Myxococcota bacterium]|nr:Pvc16 family protein [Myxococcota bacterium]
MTELQPQQFQTGPLSSYQTIGEVTEAIHKRLLDCYDVTERPPRLEEDLKFVPKDREEVIYVYMYRAGMNPNLMNQKRLRLAPLEVTGANGEKEYFYHRPPLLMDLFYLVGVHAKFRSDAERLLGWVLLTLNSTPRLIYRPRRFILPTGEAVNSYGEPWDPKGDTWRAELQVEKVSLALVDDLTVGDAINLYTLHEAPYRPFLTYRARVALDGPLTSTEGGSGIAMGDHEEGLLPKDTHFPHQKKKPRSRVMGRPTSGRISKPPGPEAHNVRRRFDRKKPEDTEE